MTTPALREEYRAYLTEPWRWRALVRRARGLTKQQKYVLVTLADYASKTGTDVKPGLPLLAADADSTYEQAKTAVRVAREIGLLVVAYTGNRRRRIADEYWLIIHPDTIDRAASRDITFETPAARNERADLLRADRHPDTGRPEDPGDPSDQATREHQQSPEPQQPGDRSDPPKQASRDPIDPRNPLSGDPTDPPTSPLTHLVPENPTTPTVDGFHAAVSVPRTHDTHPTREPCPHGRTRRTNRHGQPRCPHCRTTPTPHDPPTPTTVPFITAAGTYRPARCPTHGLPAATCTFCRRERAAATTNTTVTAGRPA